ncbi:Rha family transcriptional regulator [Fusobacterium necrophorum]|uniref:Rha family transcriptional regulator n=1 Tax=Fusobacterium necrophorum TaxID=859 RepID=UPI00254B5D4B|nr:Rha family transcriptional regulator [Fusobacterium necrophorum]MDK4497938.1 Rha family transcriptional regulator [Fusobacterium necrophorum]
MNSITNVNTMTSIEVAELTGKRHADIMRDIRDEVEKLENQEVSTERIFALSDAIKQVELYPCTT